MKKFAIIAFVILLAVGEFPAKAQDTVTKAKTLPAFSIRHKLECRFQKLSSIEQNEVITADGLKGLACCNLGESFENSASVDVGYSDAVTGCKQIQLLGLTGIYSQMMLENIPFLRGVAAPYGLGFVPGQWLESISVSKGAGTVKNGYESITGCINLEFEKPQRGNRFTLNLYENSDLKSEITAKLNHRFNDNLSTGLYVFGTKNLLRVDHLGHDGFMDFPMQTQANIVNRWLYQADNGFHSISLINYVYENRFGGQMEFQPEMWKNDSIYGFGGTTKRLHFFTKNGFPINDKSSLGTQISASYIHQDAFYGKSDYCAKEKNFYANILYDRELGAFTSMTAGISMRYSDIDEGIYSDPYLGALIFSNDTLAWGQMCEVVPGVFGEYTLKLGTIFTTTAGLRYDYNSFFHRHLITPRLHLRWEPVETYIIRASIGRGFRAANVIADNFGILASSRNIHVLGNIDIEESWNGGVNFTKNFQLSKDRTIKLTADYYHTEFVNQLVADLDASPFEAYFNNLEGRSFSDVVQMDVTIEPFRNFEVTLAGKLNNVKCTYHNVLMDKPYTSKWRGLLVFTYHTPFEKWRFDLTTQLNGPMRLPLNVSEHNGYSKPYIYMLGQVTRKFKHSDLYVGIENITNYVQPHPIAGYQTPFSQSFDASVVYAPLMGRLFYLGFRYNIR
ncbi:MAG: TonB-dependent receptor [Bacteroidales bacterium]|nr:TonB-dependent receptor [Bacteroidales bacterium]